MGSHGKELATEVREAARAALSAAAPIFATQPPLDRMRVTRKDGSGLITEDLDYRGHKTVREFSSRIYQVDGITAFLYHATHDQPEIVGHQNTPGSCVPMPDAAGLLAFWCSKVVERVDSGLSFDVAIEELLSDVDDVLRKGCARVERRIFLHGLEMPIEVKEVPLVEDLVIRRITERDRAESNPDFSGDQSTEIACAETSYMLVASGWVDMTFSAARTGDVQSGIPHEIAPPHVDHVLRSLHIMKRGRVAAISAETHLLPDVFPRMGEITRSRMPLSRLRRELSLDEVGAAELPSIFLRLGTNRWQTIHVAAGRLADAAGRLSEVDALVDAMVGLDIMLNAGDRGELSFRATLNYAFLGEPSERRERYDTLHALHVMRNKVLHGGVQMDSTHADAIKKAAADASECLRDVLRRFLTDDALGGAAKKEAKFWVDRILSG